MSNRLTPNVMINFDASTLTGTHQVINAANTAEAAFMVKFYNSSTSLIALSFDGVNDNDFVPPGGAFILDIQGNADTDSGQPNHYQLKKGQLIYARTITAADRLLMVTYS